MTYDNVSADRKKKLAVIGVSSIILVAMVVALAVGINEKEGGGSSGSTSSGGQVSTSTKSIQAICEPTDYKQTCVDSLSKAAGDTSDPYELVQAGFQVSMDELKVAIENSTTLKEVAKDPMAKQALDNCVELLDTTNLLGWI